MLKEIDSRIANNPILQIEAPTTQPTSKRTKSVPLSKMKPKHSPKSTSSQKHKERKTKAKKDIPPMQPLEEEESHDEPLRSQRLAQKRAAKEIIDVEQTPSKKAKKDGEKKKEVPAKSPPKETNRVFKGIEFNGVQPSKSKNVETPKGKGKQKMYPDEPIKEKKKSKLYIEDEAEDLILIERPKKKGRNFNKRQYNFNKRQWQTFKK